MDPSLHFLSTLFGIPEMNPKRMHRARLKRMREVERRVRSSQMWVRWVFSVSERQHDTAIWNGIGASEHAYITCRLQAVGTQRRRRRCRPSIRDYYACTMVAVAIQVDIALAMRRSSLLAGCAMADADANATSFRFSDIAAARTRRLRREMFNHTFIHRK